MNIEIKKYFLRILVFLIVTCCLWSLIFHLFGEIHSFIGDNIINPIFNIQTISEEELWGGWLGAFYLIIGVVYFSFIAIGITYFFAKISGLFREIDKLKRWQSFLLLLIITILCYIIVCKVPDGFAYELFDKLDISASLMFGTLMLIPAYVMHIFFGFLGKKYIFFKKLGYCFSINFYKNLISKFISNRFL